MRQFERRGSLRADLSVFATETTETADKITRTQDISEHGMRYIAPVYPTDGINQEISVRLCLPGENDPLSALGRIVHLLDGTHTRRIAIEFTYLGARDAERIRRYIQRRKRAEMFESLRREHLLQ